MNQPMFQKTKNLDITESSNLQNMKRQHYHETYELYLQLDGERKLFFDNEIYTLKKGSLFFINPFVLHMTGSAENSYFKRYLLNFSTSALSTVLTSSEIDKLLNGLHSFVINLDDEHMNGVYFYLNQINFYAGFDDEHFGKLMQMSLTLLLNYIRILIKSHTSITLLANDKSPKSPIYSAIAYVNSNYNQEITLDFISEYVHMSKSNFCLIFKKTIGDTFIVYLNYIRISHVHKLMLSTNMPLNEIANKVGFSSTEYMTRIFKRVHGVAPSVFRRQFSQTENSKGFQRVSKTPLEFKKV